MNAQCIRCFWVNMNITLPSAERCSENNFKIISRKSKESSAAERERDRESETYGCLFIFLKNKVHKDQINLDAVQIRLLLGNISCEKRTFHINSKKRITKRNDKSGHIFTSVLLVSLKRCVTFNYTPRSPPNHTVSDVAVKRWTVHPQTSRTHFWNKDLVI